MERRQAMTLFQEAVNTALIELQRELRLAETVIVRGGDPPKIDSVKWDGVKIRTGKECAAEGGRALAMSILKGCSSPCTVTFYRPPALDRTVNWMTVSA